MNTQWPEPVHSRTNGLAFWRRWRTVVFGDDDIGNKCCGQRWNGTAMNLVSTRGCAFILAFAGGNKVSLLEKVTLACKPGHQSAQSVVPRRNQLVSIHFSEQICLHCLFIDLSLEHRIPLIGVLYGKRLLDDGSFPLCKHGWNGKQMALHQSDKSHPASARVRAFTTLHSSRL